MRNAREGEYFWSRQRRRFKSVLILTATVIFASSVSRAAFNEALWGARPTSLGGAFTALADDSNAPAYNPAGIALMPHTEFTLMYASLYNGVNLNAGNSSTDLGLGYLSFVPTIRENRYGKFGVSWANFQASSLYKEDTFVLTYANSHSYESNYRAPMIFGYGANLKLLRRGITGDSRTDQDPVFSGGTDSDAVTADLGFLFRPNFDILPGLKFGVAAQNITNPDIGLAASDRVPAKYTLGVAYQDRELRWLNPSLDVARRNGRTLISAGWEGWFARDSLALRMGGNKEQLAGGLGYQFKIFNSGVMRLDYAILWPFEVKETDGSHRISLTTSF